MLLGLLLAALLVLISERAGPTRLAPPSAIGRNAPAHAATPGEAALVPLPTAVPVLAAPVAAAAPPSFVEAPPGVVPYIPILMYHYVRYVDAGADPLGYNLSVTPDQLAAQLDWLKRNGYDTVRMDTLSACLRGQGPCPARAVALTFDDGYSDAFSAALPLLQQYAATATFYIISGSVGQPGYMGWDELRALQSAGMEIGAHSITHPDLTTLGFAEASAEIRESGALIGAQLGVPITSFCYPGGRFNPDIAALTRDSGYTNATTTVQDGPQSDPFALPRLRIYGDLTQEGFEWTIRAYLP